MWRGPVWVNYNWLIAYGLERYNLVREAETLRQKTMHEIERMYSRYGVLFEFFDDEQAVDPPQLLRKGKCAPEISPFHQVFHDYGWTATLYVDMALSKR
jgi:neutral trehalase